MVPDMADGVAELTEMPWQPTTAASELLVLGAVEATEKNSAMLHWIDCTQLLTFLLFLIVTLLTPVTGFMPSFCIAFLLFFSERLCLPPLPLAPASPSSSAMISTQTSF